MTGDSAAPRRFARIRSAAELVKGKPWSLRTSSTGLKMFGVLMLALLPLGVLAVIGTIQTIRTAEMERVAGINLAIAQGSIRLASAVTADRAALRLVANSLAGGTGSTAICARASAQLKAVERRLRFAFYDDRGTFQCGTSRVRGSNPAYNWNGELSDQQVTLLPATQQLIVRIASQGGNIRGMVSYEAADLAGMTGIDRRYSAFSRLTLEQGRSVVRLIDRGRQPRGENVDEASIRTTVGGLRLRLVTQRPPVDLIRFVAMGLPLMLWLLAAGAGWWVVNRYFMRPLISLNAYVAAYEPGTVLGELPSEATLASEIRTLGETFREIAEDVVDHEAKLAEGLVRQRALTREVHHRVKNNLQIISSLINLHSRATDAPGAEEAYASIQRRVDALSVVHRNHYAAVEYSRGIDAQALIGELASALKASTSRASLAIRVAGDNLYVSQDVAVPVAFLITELVELVILSGMPQPVLVALRSSAGEEGAAELSIASIALKPSETVSALLSERFERVLSGLSRQLRTPLEYDPAAGRYSMRIAAVS